MEAPQPEPALPQYPHPEVVPSVHPPRYGWMNWGSAALGLLVLLDAMQLNSRTFLPLLVAFVVLALLNTIRYLPRSDSRVFRRLPMLAILVLPWIAPLVFGEDIAVYALAASVVLPILLLLPLPGARKATVVFGLLNLVCTILAALASLKPGS